ncbi:mucin-13-like [Dreissena polymorpha]|uniref:EGF-like domain-containing protein n=1 Tax=Dreissena polymorpha TaxID=45954 RepID=A0A9D4JTS8_DREPO|nr:mucin-13-like [Dreissena polymorpha]KAH3819952.1 hypothetical protein DPMN_121696 [Dreissena polymorpha]
MFFFVVLIIGMLYCDAQYVPDKCNENKPCSDNTTMLCEEGFCHIAIGKKCTTLTEQTTPSQTGQDGSSSRQPISTVTPANATTGAQPNAAPSTTTSATQASKNNNPPSSTSPAPNPSSSATSTPAQSTTIPSSIKPAEVNTTTQQGQSTIQRKKRNDGMQQECVSNGLCSMRDNVKLCECVGGYSKDDNGLCKKSGADSFHQAGIQLFSAMVALIFLI